MYRFPRTVGRGNHTVHGLLFVRYLFDLIQPLRQRIGIFVAGGAGHDWLVAEHDGIAIGGSSVFVLPVMIGCRQIAHDEVGTFFGTHSACGSWRGEYLCVDFDDAILSGDMSVAVLCQLFRIGVAAAVIGRMVGQELVDGTWMALAEIHYPLPDVGAGTRVVVRMRDVVKGQSVSLTFHWLCDVAVVDDLGHEGTSLTASGCSENFHVEGAARAFCRMIFLTMSELMAEH